MNTFSPNLLPESRDRRFLPAAIGFYVGRTHLAKRGSSLTTIMAGLPRVVVA